MKLPVIQSLWIGSPLSNLEKLCVQSFLDHGHEFHLYVYDDIDGIPNGTTVMDANEIIPSSEIFYTRKKYIAPFSDWFRYALIAKRGGVWVDMDTICIKPFDFDEKIVFGYFESFRAIIGILKFPQNHFLMHALESFCRDHTQAQPWDNTATEKTQSFIVSKEKISYQAFGNDIFDKAVRYYGLEDYGKPYTYFYPLNHEQAKTLFDDSFKDGIGLYPATHSMHISNKVLWKSGIDKNSNFSEHSLFEQLKRKHGITPAPNAPTVGAKQVQALFTRSAMEHEKRGESRSAQAGRKNSRKEKLTRTRIIATVAVLVSFAAGFFLAALIMGA